MVRMALAVPLAAGAGVMTLLCSSLLVEQTGWRSREISLLEWDQMDAPSLAAYHGGESEPGETSTCAGLCM